MDDRYYEDDEFTPREHLDNNERGDGAIDEPWVEKFEDGRHCVMHRRWSVADGCG